MAEIVSAYPTAGGIYYWASKMGGPAWGWFTGWFNLIGLIGVGRVGRLRLRAVPLDHDLAVRLGLERARAEARLHHLPVPARGAHGAQHLPGPHPLDLEQHLGLLAHRRAGDHRPDPHLRARCHQSFSWVFTERSNASGFFDGTTTAAGWLVLRAAVRRSAPDAVHDHGLRRVRAPVGGDQGRVDGRRQGRVEVDLLLAIGGWILLLCFLSRRRTSRRSTSSPTASRSSDLQHSLGSARSRS